MGMNLFVQKVADGMIFSVDWREICEMLGEEKGRGHVCSLHPNADVFPPVALETDERSLRAGRSSLPDFDPVFFCGRAESRAMDEDS